MTALALTTLLILPHTTAQVDDWLTDWSTRVDASGGLSVALVDEYRDFRERHVCHFDPCVPDSSHDRSIRQASESFAGGVEQWRPLVAAYFPPDQVDNALRVMDCESRGDPNAANPRSTARGLFQMIGGWWRGEWGYPAFDPYDPVENVKAAGWLYGRKGWTPWVCRP